MPRRLILLLVSAVERLSEKLLGEKDLFWEVRRFQKFILVGAGNTLIGYSIYALLVFVGVYPLLSLGITNVIVVTVNFWTYGTFVFKSRDTSRFCRFVLVHCTALGVNALALDLLMGTGLSAYLAQALILPPLAAGLYAAQRLFVFPRMASTTTRP